MKPRCGHWMPIAQAPCGRVAGHKGRHETEAALKRGNSRANPKVRRRKQEWDHRNRKDVCPSCGGVKWAKGRRCRHCYWPGRPAAA